MNPSRFLQLIVRAQNIAPLPTGRVIATWLTMMRWTETTHFLHLIVLSVKDRLHRKTHDTACQIIPYRFV
ncbi:MAG: hypothetical protein PUG32_08805, partial [Bacteroidales bacterium]|nr:hypothetical protein [Bacteroidales bacterium]